MIALLGRRDEPTDALRDYCSWLAQAIRRRGQTLEMAEVAWDADGWPKALWAVWKRSRAWRGAWVLFQHTGLMWSRRGFPLGALVVLWLLRRRGNRIAVVFHDVSDDSRYNWPQRFRLSFQYFVMKTAYRWCECPILTVPAEHAPWLAKADQSKAIFIPVGANFPEPARPGEHAEHKACAGATIAVFGVTSGAPMATEIADIAYVVKGALRCASPLRLVVLGRGSSEAESHLRRTLNGSGVEVSVLGLLPSEKLAGVLSAADVLLFVRGHVSSRRSSAIAGIACGLPIVGYSGVETDYPITAAGVLLVPQRDREALARALHRVLTDPALRGELRERSRAAQREHFSWDAIAGRYLAALADYELAATSASPSYERRV